MKNRNKRCRVDTSLHTSTWCGHHRERDLFGLVDTEKISVMIIVIIIVIFVIIYKKGKQDSEKQILISEITLRTVF